MVHSMSLLARLVATHALLFVTATMNTSLAGESALAPNQSPALTSEHSGGHPQGAGSNTSDAANGGTADTKAGGKGALSGKIDGVAKGDAGTLSRAGAKANPAASSEEKIDARPDTFEEHGKGRGVGPNQNSASPGKDKSEFDDRAAIHRSATDPNPIDTSITVQAASRLRHATKGDDWKKPRIVVPSTDVRSQRRTLATPTEAGVVRNAIGQPIQTRQARQGLDGRIFTRAVVDGIERSVTNAPGIGPASAGGPDFQRQISIPVTVTHAGTNDLPVYTTMNHSIINGTGMGRPGLGIGVIGGAAKNVAGVLSGTNFRPKHP
jgi:hypothetical protein